jgi:hydroxymethylpyrimidine pyrophosphatase-like HAD family hydrolase
VAISRKLGRDVFVNCHQPENECAFWVDAFLTFVRAFDDVVFRGIVLDYDGTLCASRERFSGIGKEIASVLTKLLKAGIMIGIATGRGKSVRHDLQKKIPKRLWGRILVGYYNGSVIGKLTDDDIPRTKLTPTGLMSAVASAVETHPVLRNSTTCEARQNQLSLQPKIPGTTIDVWRIAQQTIQSFPGVRAVISSHSVDLLAPGVSKRQIVGNLEKLISKEGPILTIGDKGAWPGNDFELLSLPHSLSVDEVSAEPGTCWNLAPLGHRGPQAALDYLHALRVTKSTVSLDYAHLSNHRPFMKVGR